MTVKDLKDFLKLFPDNMRIMIDKYDNIGYDDAEIYPLDIINEDEQDETILHIC